MSPECSLCFPPLLKNSPAYTSAQCTQVQTLPPLLWMLENKQTKNNSKNSVSFNKGESSYEGNMLCCKDLILSTENEGRTSETVAFRSASLQPCASLIASWETSFWVVLWRIHYSTQWLQFIPYKAVIFGKVAVKTIWCHHWFMCTAATMSNKVKKQ